MSNWKLENVSKQFGDTTAIKGISLEIEKNKIYGLIGRNGAGKTTLLKLLANQLQPTAGVIRQGTVNIKDNDRLTRNICLARESIKINGVNNFSAKKIFNFAALIYPNWDQEFCRELTNKFDLDLNKKYNKLSKGMQTVVGIIIGLASRAPLTLFDEPYVGLDPVAREIFYELLLMDYEQHKRTIILSSHLINELENLFERVLIIDRGNLLLNENMEEIKDKARLISGDKDIVDSILQGKRVIYQQTVGRLANYTVLDTFTEDELQQLSSADISYSSINLQKLFVNLSKGGLLNENK